MKYVPQGLRHLQTKVVKAPIRKVINKDPHLTAYYREGLLVTSQTAQYYAEKLLDSDISIHERMLIQEQKNTLDKIVYGICDQLTEKQEDKQYERTHFITEMIQLSTLVLPKHFKLVQDFVVKKIQQLRKL